jgi:hypothetical protein
MEKLTISSAKFDGSKYSAQSGQVGDISMGSEEI